MDESLPLQKNKGYRLIAVLLVCVVVVGVFALSRLDGAKNFFLINVFYDLTAREGGDMDNDGLENAEETLYQTYFWKSDTDCDGYSDGEEVKNGFQPRGSGKLSDNDISLSVGDGC